MIATRWRMTTQQGDEPPHISSVVLAPHEVEETLDAELAMHIAARWQVLESGEHEFVVKSDRGVVRRCSVREFTPFNDIQRA